MKKILLLFCTAFFVLGFIAKAQRVLPCKLKADFSFQVDSCTIYFVDGSGVLTGTAITNWFWNFGDGSNSTLQSPQHSYVSSGTYSVCLTIIGVNTEGKQCSDTYCRSIKVKDCNPPPPCTLQANYLFTADRCTIHFSDNSTAGSGTTITNWSWDFGDATTSTMQYPTHTYTASGTYTVCLTINGVNQAGKKCKDKICRKVTVDCGETETCQLFPKFDTEIYSCTAHFYDFSLTGSGTTISSWYWDFGDSASSMLQNPVHTYDSSGTYIVCLTVAGMKGESKCEKSFCYPITVKCNSTNPCQVFSKFDFKTDSCTVFFNDLSTAASGSTITDWYWDFGDSTTSVLQHPDHVYAASGTYTVCLIVAGKNTKGEECRDQHCMEIMVDCGEVLPCQLFSKFDFKTDSCTVFFNDLSTAASGSTITDWYWDFGDSTTSVLQHPDHVYAASGTYTVCLVVAGKNIKGEECKDQHCMEITVDCGEVLPCQLFSKFDFKTDSCTVFFNDLSTAASGSTITDWYWDFGDSTTSVLQHPDHVYAASGTYTVCLVVAGKNTKGEECKDQHCMAVTVDCGEALPCQLFSKFDFKIDTCTVHFQDFSSAATGTTINSWYWDFGDGDTTSAQNPTHVYGGSGTYNVCLVIAGTNSKGQECNDQRCVPVTVQCGEIPACQVAAKFDFKIDSCNVSFQDLSNIGTGTTITNWYWDFGDGTSSMLQNPTHVYMSSGSYTVCLIVVGKNAAGEECKNEICIPLYVKSCGGVLPCYVFPKFEFKQDSCDVSFTDLSSSGANTTITNWYWDFGDGVGSTGQHPQHTYSTSGLYLVCLNVVGTTKDSIQCEYNICEYITITDCSNILPCQLFPKFDFKVDSCHVSFTDSSSSGAGTSITGRYWDFGDGNTSTMQYPSYKYKESGTYLVCLTISGKTKDNQVCEETTCQLVAVQSCKDSVSACQLSVNFDIKMDSCTATFNDASTTGTNTTIVNRYWNFGDGAVSSLQNPVHTYTASGTYMVCLTVYASNKDSAVCEERICRLVTVKDCGQALLCELFPAFDSKVDGCSASFTDLSSSGTGTTITNWYWDFGDGDTSSMQHPTHTYAISATFEACLIIEGKGPTDKICRQSSCSKVVINCAAQENKSDKVDPSLLKVYPNPAQDQVNINFKMLRAGQATVTIMDIQGKILAVIQDGFLTTGLHSLQWKVSAPSGMYLVTLKTDSGIERKQLMIQP